MTERQRNERPPTPLHVKIEQMLTEARVILPGAQALFGFQLAIVLTQSFETLPELSRLVHAVSLGLVAFAVMGFLVLQARYRSALVILITAISGELVGNAMKHTKKAAAQLPSRATRRPGDRASTGFGQRRKLERGFSRPP